MITNKHQNVLEQSKAMDGFSDSASGNARTMPTIHQPALTWEGQGEAALAYVEDDPDQVLAEAKRAGVNVAALEYNLTLSPKERIDKFLKALAWLEWAKKARR